MLKIIKLCQLWMQRIGMKHADENMCKYKDSTSTQMMASVLDLTKTEYEWSNCSVVELNDFLRCFFVSHFNVILVDFIHIQQPS